MLHEWYFGSFTYGIPMRYLFHASHHANQAAGLGIKIAPKGAGGIPEILNFGRRSFEEFAKERSEMLYWWKDIVKALKIRDKQVDKFSSKMAVKRMKNPNRYRCANVGCGIIADKGKMLPKCEYIPYYLVWIGHRYGAS